jgi:polysaccharide biosynthesis transport protein
MFGDHPAIRPYEDAPDPRAYLSVPRARNRATALPMNGSPIDDRTTKQPSFIEAILRHKLAIALTTVAGGVLGFALTIPQTRLYRAHTSLEFAGINENVMNTRDVDPSATADNSSQSYINTQARVLESQPLLRRVVQKLKEHRFEDTVHLSGAGAGQIGFEVDKRRRDEALQELSPLTLSRSIQIRPVDAAKLVDIYVQSPDPQVAAVMADTLVQEYVAQTIENRLNASQVTSGWLSKELGEARARLEHSEAALQAYARKSNLLFTGAQDGSVSEARLRQIQDEFSRAQADRASKQSVYEELLAENPEDKAASLRDPALADYQMKLSDLNRQLADLSSVYSPGYEKLRRVQSQIAELKQDYDKQHEVALTRVKNDFDTAQRRERLLASAFNAQQGVVTSDAAKAVDYNILKREAETNRALYEGMLQKVKSYGIASAMQPSNARMVDPAETPLFPYKPNVPLITLFGTMGGFMLAVVWAGVRDKGAVHVQYPGQMKQVLETPELGVIPAARLDPYFTGGVARALRPARQDGDSDNGSALQKSVETATWFCKSSLLAESVRSIRTSLLFHPSIPGPHVIVVTSLGPAHGKTSLVSNLGIAMAEAGRKVLMIDADLRRPALHRTFGISNERGLTDALTGDSRDQLDALTRSTVVPSLTLLPSGEYGANSATAMFHSHKMADLLSAARKSYDIVLVDTPPLLLSDARVLGPLSDGVVLVLRAGEVKVESVLAAEERLMADGSRLLGTVLNNWDPRSNGYGSYPERYYKRSYYQPVSR